MFTIYHESLLIIAEVLLALVLVAIAIILVLWNKNINLKTEKKIAELEIAHLNLKLGNREERIKLQSELIAKNADKAAFKDLLWAQLLSSLYRHSVYNLRVHLRELQSISEKKSAKTWDQMDKILETAYYNTKK